MNTTKSKTDSRVLSEIKEALKKSPLNQEEFAIEMGYKKGWATNILKGKRSISTNTLIKIAEILKIEPSSLLPGKQKEGNPKNLEDYIIKITKPHMRQVFQEELDKFFKDKKIEIK